MMPDDNLILSALGGEVRNRTRRTRETAAMRRMVRETRLSVDNLIYPMFVVEGENIKQEISSMPGQYQLSRRQARGGLRGNRRSRTYRASSCSAFPITRTTSRARPMRKTASCRTRCARSRKPAPSFASSRMFVFANTWITAIAASSRAIRY